MNCESQVNSLLYLNTMGSFLLFCQCCYELRYKELPCVAPWAPLMVTTPLPPHAVKRRAQRGMRVLGWLQICCSRFTTFLPCCFVQHVNVCPDRSGHAVINQVYDNNLWLSSKTVSLTVFLLHSQKFTAEYQLCVSIFSWACSYVVMTNTIVLFPAASLCKLENMTEYERLSFLSSWTYSAEALWGSVRLCCIHPDYMNRHL